jgi:hypothetical protein
VFHIIYKVSHPNGKYYIGRHTTKNLEDGYLGSGKWVRSLKNKSVLKKEVLQIVETFEELLLAEKTIIADHIDEQMCMNFNDNPVGFGSGKYNPSKKEVNRQKISMRVSGENNPMRIRNGHTEETNDRISQSMMGDKNPFYGKTHNDDTKRMLSLLATGRTQTEETKQKYRENHKNGLYSHLDRRANFKGKEHSDETKEKWDNPMHKEKMQNVCIVVLNLRVT